MRSPKQVKTCVACVAVQHHLSTSSQGFVQSVPVAPQAMPSNAPGSHWAMFHGHSPLQLCEGQFPQDQALQPVADKVRWSTHLPICIAFERLVSGTHIYDSLYVYYIYILIDKRCSLFGNLFQPLDFVAMSLSPPPAISKFGSQGLGLEWMFQKSCLETLQITSNPRPNDCSFRVSLTFTNSSHSKSQLSAVWKHTLWRLGCSTTGISGPPPRLSAHQQNFHRSCAPRQLQQASQHTGDTPETLRHSKCPRVRGKPAGTVVYCGYWRQWKPPEDPKRESREQCWAPGMSVCSRLTG